MVLTTIAVMTMDKSPSEFGHILVLWNIQRVWWADMPSKVEGTLTAKKASFWRLSTRLCMSLWLKGDLTKLEIDKNMSIIIDE